MVDHARVGLSGALLQALPAVPDNMLLQNFHSFLFGNSKERRNQPEPYRFIPSSKKNPDEPDSQE